MKQYQMHCAKAILYLVSSIWYLIVCIIKRGNKYEKGEKRIFEQRIHMEP